MLLTRGPFEPIAIDAGFVKSEAPVFVALAQSADRDLGGHEDDLADVAFTMDQALQELPALDISEEMDLVATEVDRVSHQDFAGEISDIQRNANEGDELISNAFAIIPGEGFQPVPDPFNVVSTPEGPSLPNPMELTLYNVSRPGATEYEVGQAYEIRVRIQPYQGGSGLYAGVEIEQFPVLNDVVIPKRVIGSTDANGFLTVRGTWTAQDAGHWDSTWFANDVLAGPTLHWSVSGAPPHIPTPTGPVVSSAIDVALANLSNTNNPNFRVGDRFRLAVVGQPNKPVEIGGSYNGVALSPAILGQTDQLGVFTLEGQMSTFEVGHWIETYKVGAFSWAGRLEFDVSN